MSPEETWTEEDEANLRTVEYELDRLINGPSTTELDANAQKLIAESGELRDIGTGRKFINSVESGLSELPSAVAGLPGQAWNLLKKAGGMTTEARARGEAYQDLPLGIGPALTLGRAAFEDPKDPSTLTTVENAAEGIGRGGATLAGWGVGGPIGAAGASTLFNTVVDSVPDFRRGEVPPPEALDLGAIGDEFIDEAGRNTALFGYGKAIPAVRGMLPDSADMLRRIPQTPRTPVMDVAATRENPINMDAAALGQRLSGVEGAPKEAPRVGTRAGAQLELGATVRTRPASTLDELGAQLGVMEGQGTANLGMYSRWQRDGETIAGSGLLQKGLSGEPLLKEAKATSEWAAGEKTRIAQAIDKASGNAIIPFDAIEPHMSKVLSHANTLELLPEITGPFGAAIKETVEAFKRAIEPLRFGQKLPNGTIVGGQKPGMTASELVEATQAINWYEREIGKLFDNPALASAVQQNASTAGISLEQSAKALNAGRDGINKVLDARAVELAISPEGTFQALNKSIGAMHTLEDLVENQLRTKMYSTSNVSERRIVPTTAQPASPNQMAAATATGIIAPKVGLGMRALNYLRGGVQDPAVPAIERMSRARMRPELAGTNINAIMSEPPQAGVSMPGAAGGDVTQAGPMSVLKPGRPRMAELGPAAAGMIDRVMPRIESTAAALRQFGPGLAGQVVEFNRQAFKLPRSFETLTPGVIGPVLFKFMPPMEAQQAEQRISELYNLGDKDQIGQYMSLLLKQYPQIPIAKGPITGYSSEFPLSPEKSRLYDPEDRSRWEMEIDRAPISAEEKAHRAKAIREHGIVYPMNIKLAPQTQAQPSRDPSSPTFQYSARTAGGRRLQ